MAGIIAVYGLVVSVLIVGGSKSIFLRLFNKIDADACLVTPDDPYSLYA